MTYLHVYFLSNFSKCQVLPLFTFIRYGFLEDSKLSDIVFDFLLWNQCQDFDEEIPGTSSSCVDLCWYKSSIDNALRSSGNFFSFISVANLQDEIRVTSFWHLSLFSLIELSQLHHVFDSKTGTTMMSFKNGFSSWDVQHHCWTFLGTTVHSGGQQTTNCSCLYSLKTRIVN